MKFVYFRTLKCEMGGGKWYSREEILALARIKVANPEKQLGPAFWEEQARENQLPPILMARIRMGGDLAKYLNRHEPEIARAITEIIMETPVRGRSH